MRALTVTHKIFGVIAGSILVLVLFQLLYFPRWISRESFAGLHDKTLSLARLTAYEVASALELDNRTTVLQLFDGLKQDRDFLYAGLFDGRGELFAALNLPEALRQRPPKLGKRPYAVIRDGQLLRASMPVPNSSGAPGLLLLALSTQKLEQAIATNVRWTWIMALGVLAAGALLAWLFGRSLGGRLAQLETIAQRVTAGDLSAPKIGKPGADEIGRLTSGFVQMIEHLRRLEASINRVADGDLTVKIDSAGDLSVALNRMISNQRDLVERISRVSAQLSSAAGEFFATAQQQARGAVEQSSAVEQNRRTMEALSHSGAQISETAQAVLRNAESTQHNAQAMAERISTLTAHTARIAEILEVIREIANKSDLLALNAAIEGTKAGEAGRGFSLVASQMQRLAESVMGSVRDIKELTGSISVATESTTAATSDTTRLSGEATRSARQIAMITQQQQLGTEQVRRALDEVARIAGQSATASEQIVRSASDLATLAEVLTALLGRFDTSSSQSRAELGHAPASRPSASAA